MACNKLRAMEEAAADMELIKKAEEAAKMFEFEGNITEITSYGNGHINDTFLVVTELSRYILQRINTNVFKKPVELMENIKGVTTYLKEKIAEQGGNPSRETLNVIPAKTGKSYYVDSDGGYWRAYLFVVDTVTCEEVKNPEDFYESAVSFGNFQRLLEEYPAHTLHETIPGFHDTKARFIAFEKAVGNDKMGRANDVQEEIQFVLNRWKTACVLGDMLDADELPLRVTHNDTKLNNILLDKQSGKGVCVIDLDTVMPGLAGYDFGDSIRFGASTGAEDEKNLDKISCDLTLFELYTKGFVEGCNGSLTNKEIEMLPMGAKVMTFECGMRFLTDYLEGDHYFKIHREDHNLDRCRTQFKLVNDMEEKWDKLEAIVSRYIKR